MDKFYKASAQAGIEIFEPTEVVASDDFGKLHKANIKTTRLSGSPNKDYMLYPLLCFLGR